jgi:hypothetical protein
VKLPWVTRLWPIAKKCYVNIKEKMKAIQLIIIITGTSFLFNCTTTRPISTGGITAYGIDKQEIVTNSLFDSKDRTISEADIQRLLKGKILIPDTVRVAIFKYSSTSINRYYTNWWTDEEYLKTQQSFVDELVGQIGGAKKVKKVIPVPTLMTSTTPNMTQLRETAVRLQSDILIVYSITSDIYYKYKVFQKNEAKAFATCETILMDTRTGVIPHTSIITREKIMIKDQQDLTDTETRKKAERDAILSTLVETGKQISKFLDDN